MPLSKFLFHPTDIQTITKNISYTRSHFLPKFKFCFENSRGSLIFWQKNGLQSDLVTQMIFSKINNFTLCYARRLSTWLADVYCFHLATKIVY